MDESEHNQSIASEPEREDTEPAEEKPKRKRRRWPWVLLIIFVAMFLLAFGFYEYSNTPGFCGSCHIMEPYYKAWETSKHNFAACTECHISPEQGAVWDAKIQGMLQVFKYVTRTYSSKPYAEIEDSSCLRSGCHSKRLVEAYSTEEFKNHVVFDHRPHLTQIRRGRHLRCTSCHAQMVVGTHMEVTTSTCYLCHFRESITEDVAKLSACRLCHKRLPDKTLEHKVPDPTDASKTVDTVSFDHGEFIADRNVDCRSCHVNAIQGDGAAKKDRCFDCHNVPEHLNRFNDIEFIHDNHITEHNVTCERCHEAIRHEVQTQFLGMEQACNRCHDSLHNGQRSMYLGVGGREVEERMPSVKYSRMVDCSGCHYGAVDKSKGSQWLGYSRMISREGCNNCHGEDAEDYWEALQDYTSGVKERLREVKGLLGSARSLSRVATGPRGEALRKAVDDAAYDIEFIEQAHGWAHNWGYSEALLDAAEENLNAAIGR
ncbi:MAG TPA: cytochrome c3 family protein [Acidobacteriota bacterium]|nr:cytochrome c3 family protein [Acidobacteriota bacterium]